MAEKFWLNDPVAEGGKFWESDPVATPPEEASFAKEFDRGTLFDIGKGAQTGAEMLGRQVGGYEEFMERGGPLGYLARKTMGPDTGGDVGKGIGFAVTWPLKLAGKLGRTIGGDKLESEETAGQVTSEYFGEKSAQSRAAREKANPGSMAGIVSEGAVSMAPSLAAGPAGMTAMAIAAGAQVLGGTYADAIDENLRRNPGMTRQQAADKAAVPAMLDGLQTALLTRLVPGGESAIANIFRKQGEKSAKDFGAKLINQYFKTAVGRLGVTLAKEGALEGIEEGANQWLSGAIERWTFNPDKSWDEIVSEAGLAGSVGMVLGAGMGGVGKLLGGRDVEPPPPQPAVEPTPAADYFNQRPLAPVIGAVDKGIGSMRLNQLDRAADILAQGQPLTGVDLDFVNRLDDDGRSRLVSLAEEKLKAISPAESYFKVPSQGAEMPSYPTLGDAAAQSANPVRIALPPKPTAEQQEQTLRSKWKRDIAAMKDSMLSHYGNDLWAGYEKGGWLAQMIVDEIDRRGLPIKKADRDWAYPAEIGGEVPSYPTLGDVSPVPIPRPSPIAPAVMPPTVAAPPTITRPVAEPSQKQSQRNWDLYTENLIGELDSFSPARDTGRRNYELDDVASRFVDYARKDKSGKPLSKLAVEFAKIDEANDGNLRKLKQAVSALEKSEQPTSEPLPQPKARLSKVGKTERQVTANESVPAATYFHGTREGIEGALKPGLGKNAKRFLHEEGIWFAPNRGKDFNDSWVSDATRYSGDSGTIISATLTYKNPFYGDVNEIVTRKINAKWLKDNGYDAFVDNVSGSGFVAVLDPSQVKETGREKLKGGDTNEKVQGQKEDEVTPTIKPAVVGSAGRPVVQPTPSPNALPPVDLSVVQDRDRVVQPDGNKLVIRKSKDRKGNETIYLVKTANGEPLPGLKATRREGGDWTIPKPMRQVLTGSTVETPKRIARGISTKTLFDQETEIVGDDIINWMANNMQMMSKSDAQKQKSKEWWTENQSLYNDAAPLKRPYHNKIYGGTLTPDKVALEAFGYGKISDSDVNVLWAAIHEASAKRANAFKTRGGDQQALQNLIDAEEEWLKAVAEGEERVTADQLAIGDKFEVDGEPFVVVDIDPDTGDVVIEDGRKFGRKILRSGQAIWVEKYTSAEGEAKADDFFAGEDATPEAQPPAAEPVKPAGGELFGAATPFNLIQDQVAPPPTPRAEETKASDFTQQVEMFDIQKITPLADPAKSADAAVKLYGTPAEAVKKIAAQLAVIDSDPETKRAYTKEQRDTLRQVVALLNQRATEAARAKPATPPSAPVSKPVIQTDEVEKSKIVVVGDGEKVPPGTDFVMTVATAKNYFTLWYKVINPNRPTTWNYVAILGRNRDEAFQRSREAAERIASGDMTGISFVGKEKLNVPKQIALRNYETDDKELMGVDRISIGEQAVGFGKHTDVLVKDLFRLHPDYANWLVDNATGRRGAQVADYIRSMPEFIVARDAKISEARDLVESEAAALKNLGIEVSATNHGTIIVGGKTYDWKEQIKSDGGRFDGNNQTWYFATPQQFKAFADRLRGVAAATSGQGDRPTAYITNPRIRGLREAAQQAPDESGFDEPIGQYIGADTSALISRGKGIGIPDMVIDEQIEDVARINRAYQRNKRLFILASEPGSGKTYVLGGAIRELKKAGAKRIVYVTQRQELITQIKDDLKAFGIDDVEFITYPAMREMGSSPTDVLIFDEAHSIKNVGLNKESAKQAQKAAEWIKKSKYTVLATATPFEDPTETAYLEPTGIFSGLFGDHRSFALAFGATIYRLKSGDEVLNWKRTKTSDMDQSEARDWIIKQGIFTARRIRLPKEMVDSRLVTVQADQSTADIYAALTEAAIENEDELVPFAKMWIKNFQKRLLEASKVSIGIKEAESSLKRGRNPIIFVETKAEREIDIPDLIAKEEMWKQDVAMALQMRSEPPARDVFGLPPLGVVQVLESFMIKTGMKKILIPSAEEIIKNHFGEDKVAIFTGSVSKEKAQKNLDDWKSGRKKIIVATMAKGGTGLSLHDKVGNHPTTQINLNLPWKATQVVQVTQRSARYALQSKAEIVWLFADNIPFDRGLAARVGGRMADMGAIVHGKRLEGSDRIENWDFENTLFSDDAQTANEAPVIPLETPASQPAATTPNQSTAWAAKWLPDGVDTNSRVNKPYWNELDKPIAMPVKTATNIVTRKVQDILQGLMEGLGSAKAAVIDGKKVQDQAYSAGVLWLRNKATGDVTGVLVRNRNAGKRLGGLNWMFNVNGDWVTPDKTAYVDGGWEIIGSARLKEAQNKFDQTFNATDWATVNAAAKARLAQDEGTAEASAPKAADTPVDVSDLPPLEHMMLVADKAGVDIAVELRPFQGKINALKLGSAETAELILEELAKLTGGNDDNATPEMFRQAIVEAFNMEFALADSPVWYSRITRTVEQSPQNKASGAQWKATIRNSKLGVNKDEYALVSVDDLEDGKTYTKAEVLEYLRANEVKVEDVTLGNEQAKLVSDKAQAYIDFTNKAVDKYGAQATDWPEEVYNEWNRLQREHEFSRTAPEQNPTHFSSYQLPGGKEGSYLEVLLTVPSISIGKQTFSVRQTDDPDFPFGIFNDSTGKKVNATTTRQQAEQMAAHPNIYSRDLELDAAWRDGHSQYSDVANPIVRLRFNERTTADGKRMMFLEEVQPPQKGNFEKMPALFQKNWRDIAMKWALHHAAANGFDAVGWTTGEQQADRYDLSKQVESISAEAVAEAENVHFVNVYTTDRNAINIEVENGVIRFGEFEGKRLDEVIGKDMAEKILALEPGQDKVYKGGDLKVGGLGLKKLYDVDLRNVVNGLPVVKKAGQKVGTSEFYSDGRGNAEFHAYLEPSAREALDTSKIQSITITQAMREGVLAGQNIFAISSRPLNIKVERVFSDDELARIAQPYADWKDWYQRHQETLDEFFGDDRYLFQQLLSATSANASVKSNVGLAIKAYKQLLMGKPFTGFLGSVIANLNRIKAGIETQGQKINQFGKALEGDPAAIAVDRHVSEIIFGLGKVKPTASMVERAKQIITSAAKLINWNPSELQAALWAANIVRKGKKVVTYEERLRAIERETGLKQQLAALRSERDSRLAGSRQAGRGGVNRGAELAITGARRSKAAEYLMTGRNLGGLTEPQAQQIIAPFVQAWQGVTVNLVNDPDWTYNGQAIAGMKVGNEITLNLANIGDEQDLLAKLMHEAVAHVGLRGALGKDFDAAMAGIMEALTPAQQAQVQALADKYGTTAANAVPEWVARVAETESGKAWWKRAWQAILDFFGRVFGTQNAERMTRDLLRRGRKWLEQDPAKRGMVPDGAMEYSLVEPKRALELAEQTGDTGDMARAQRLGRTMGSAELAAQPMVRGPVERILNIANGNDPTASEEAVRSAKVLTKYRPFKSVLLGPVLEVLDLEKQLPGGLQDYQRMTSDPSVTKDQREQGILNTLETWVQFLNSYLQFKGTAEMQRVKFLRELAKLDEEMGDSTKPGTLEYRKRVEKETERLIAVVVRQGTRSALTAAEKKGANRVLQNIEGINRAVRWTLANVADWKTFKTPATLAAQIKQAAGPGYNQAVGANDESIQQAATILLKDLAQFDAIKTQYDAAMELTAANATEYQKNIANIIKDFQAGKPGMALNKYRQLLIKLGKEKGRVADAIALVHRRQQFFLDKLDAISQMETMLDEIRNDPRYADLGKALSDDTRAQAPMDVFDEGNAVVRITGFPGQPEIQLSLYPSKEAAERNLQLLTEYENKARDYLFTADTNPDYDPFIGRSLEFFLNNRMPILRSRGLLPDNPGLLPSFGMTMFGKIGDMLFKVTSIPHFALLFGRGLGYQVTREKLEAYSKMQKAAQTVYAKLWPEADRMLLNAMQRHKIKTIAEYWEKVFNPLAYSRQYNQLRPLKVGDATGTGYIITKDDLDYLEQPQSRFQKALFDVMRAVPGYVGATSQATPGARGIMENYPGLKFMFRDQLATGPNTLPRHWGRVFKWLDSKDASGRSYIDVANEARRAQRAAYQAAMQSSGTVATARQRMAEGGTGGGNVSLEQMIQQVAGEAGAKAFWQVAGGFEQFVDRNADTLLFGYVKWANEATNLRMKYAYQDAFEAIHRQVMASNQPVQSLQELAERVREIEEQRVQDEEYDSDDQLTGAPSTDEIKQTMLLEIDKLFRNAYDYREELKQEMGDPGMKDFRLRTGISSLTKARGEQMLPGEWYDYGNLGKESMLAQVANVSKPGMIELQKAVSALARQLDSKMEELLATGLTDADLKKKRMEGLDFFSYDEARDAKVELEKVGKWLSTIVNEHEGNIETRQLGGIGSLQNGWRVVLRLITSRLLAGGASMINNLFGGLGGSMAQRVLLDMPSQEIREFNELAGVTSSSWGTFRGIPAAANVGFELTKSIASRSTLTMTAIFKSITGYAANKTQIQAIQKMNEWVTASLLEQRRRWQTYQDLGLDTNIGLRDRIEMYLRLFETGGEMVDPEQTPPPSARLLPPSYAKGTLTRLVSSPKKAAKALAIAVSEASAQGGVAWVDSIINRVGAGSSAVQFEQLLQVLAHQVMPGKVTAADQAGYDWRNTALKGNFWTPSEIAHSNRGADREAVGIRRRQMLELAGVNWEAAMTDYWQRHTDWVAGGKQGDQPRFLANDTQRNGLMMAFGTRTNFADFSVRPLAAHAGGAYEAGLYLFGWPTWAAKEMLYSFSKPTSQAKGKLYPDKGTVVAGVTLIALAIPLAVISMMSTSLRDYYANLKGYQLKALTPRYLIEKALAGEDIDPLTAMKIAASSMATMVPFFGSIINNWLDNAARNGYDLQQQILALNLINDAYNTVRESLETRDPAYAGLRFAARWMLPDLAPRFLDILPLESAKTITGSLESRTANNIAAQGATLADIENRRSMTGDASFRYTPATPLIRGWMSAMATSNEADRQDYWNRLVAFKKEDLLAKNPDMDPAQAEVQARAGALTSLRSRNPFISAIGRMPSEDEHKAIMGKLTPDSRATLTAYMDRFDAALNRDSGGTASVRSYKQPDTGGATASGGSRRVVSGWGDTSRGAGDSGAATGYGGAGVGRLSGLSRPAMGRLTGGGGGRFSVSSRIRAVGRTKLPRLRLKSLRLPKSRLTVRKSRLSGRSIARLGKLSKLRMS